MLYLAFMGYSLKRFCLPIDICTPVILVFRQCVADIGSELWDEPGVRALWWRSPNDLHHVEGALSTRGRQSRDNPVEGL